jgi:predicted dehydrogenase
MERYKTAVIGCGKRGRTNARAIGRQEKLELVALVDPVKEAAESAKAEQGDEKITTYTDHREMLERERPDLCIICVWTGLHLAMFRDCAEAGVAAVFMEKPVAATWAECREIGEIADRTGCRLSISHQRRFHEGNLQARRMIEEGLFGEIIRLDLFSPKGLLDCGTHSLDQAFSYLRDQVGVKWVHGAVDLTETFEAFAIPDAAMFTGTFLYDNGVLGNIYCSLPGTDHHTGVKVFGTKGFMEFAWSGEINKFAIYDQPDFQPPEITEDKTDPMAHTLRDVIRGMESDEENELHYHKALRAAEVIFGLYESAVTRRRVTLPLAADLGHPLKELLERA